VVVAGLVVAAMRSTSRPVKNIEWAKIRLAHLVRKPRVKLTLDEVEDGIVLARRLGKKDIEKEFALVAKRLKQRRPMV
jgi:hypothetical protein